VRHLEPVEGLMKRAFILLPLSLALGLPAATASAQTGAARGKVVDEQGQPIEGAKIELDYKGGVTRKFETKTNKKGEFTQVGLQSGLYDLTVTKEGYQPGLTGGRVNLGDPTYFQDVKLKKLGAGGAAAGGGPNAADQLRASFKSALELTQAGKLDEAEAAYKDLLTKAPSIPEIHYNLAFVYAQKKDWANAEASYQKALELKPDYSDAMLALTRMYQDSGQQQKAVEFMSKAAGSGDGKMLFNLGIMYLNSGKSEEAIQALQKAETADPTNAEVQYHLGTLFVGQNKIPEAVARLEKYLSMNPTNTQNVATAQGLLQALKPKK
jgi:Tfp pilus assembly protein PilF